MRPHYLGIAALGLVAGIANTTNAQVCQGTAPFSAGSTRIGAGMQFTDGAKAYVHTQFDDLDAGSNGVSLQGGYSIAMNTSRSVQLCPLVGFAYQSGPDFDTGFGTVSSSLRAFAFGGSIGTTVAMSPTMDFVPFGGALYEMDHFSSSLGGVSSSGDDNTTVIQLGGGFVFNKVFTIQPSVLIPTESGSKPTYGISFGYNFGKPAK
jgi:hypothetical protein